MQALTLLNHVTEDSFIGGGTVLGGVPECEAQPRGKIASIDGFYLFRFDLKASGCMEVAY